MGKFSREGLCLAISGYEEDHLRFVGPDEPASYGICGFVSRAGGEITDWSESFVFEQAYEPDPDRIPPAYRNDHDEWRRSEYRRKSGNKFPPLLRVKVSVEVEYATDEETEQYWKNTQREFLEAVTREQSPTE